MNRNVNGNSTQHDAVLVVSTTEAARLINEQLDRIEWMTKIPLETGHGRIMFAEVINQWNANTRHLLRRLFSNDSVADAYGTANLVILDSAAADPTQISPTAPHDIAVRQTRLHAVLHSLDIYKLKPVDESVPRGAVRNRSSRVFIVHGHDDTLKEQVARTLGRLGLEPIILHEQPNGGKTIIEKFEKHADVGFAVVLLTPDDIGAAKPVSGAPMLTARARQNVIFELGYFAGRLGRDRVVALRKGETELPSDLHGVVWEPVDSGGAWKTKLAGELKNAGYDVDKNKI